MKNKSLLLLLIASLAVPVGSNAQENQENLVLEEIIVTARKRDESLLDIPIAINAISKETILEANITGLEDISTLASGFYFFNQGQNQPGRYNTQLRFRGLNQAQFSPSFETGALFIDGVYVLNGGTSLSLQDIQRVEVIKGPQAAYFGRNTFGGAVNFITKDPSLEGFSGEVTASYTSRDEADVQVFFEGPLSSTVAASLSGRYYDKEGHYRATDGGILGNEETQTITGKLLWQATDELSFRFRGSYSEDDDGAPAQAYIAGQRNDSCLGRPITTPAGETVNPFNFICGTVPDLNSAIPAFGSSIIDGNTTLVPGINGAGSTLQDIYNSQSLPPNVPFIDRIGLLRETTRFSVQANYEFESGYSLDFTYGKNEQYANHIRDFDLSAFPGGFSSDPQSLEDESYEIRITSPQDGNFRWSAGINYYEQDFISSLQGGTFAFGCFGIPGGNPDDCIPSPNGVGNFILGPFPNTFRESDKAEVLGIFGSVEFDITDQLTFSLEGRQQEDEVTKGGSATENGLTDDARVLEFDEFLPRVILRYKPSEATTIYGSFSKGVLPGDLNLEVFNADEQELAQILAQLPGVAESTPQEELDSFEVGIKTRIFGGRGYLNFAYYNNEWTGIKGRSSASINETCTAGDVASGATGCAFPGVVPDVSTRMIEVNGVLTTFFNSRNFLLDGDADLQGFELEVGGNISDAWSVDASLAYVDTEYTRYLFNFGERVFGFSDVAGLSVPRVPEWSGNLTSTYNFTIGKWDAFVRGDMNYFGETFTDERNLATVDDYFLVNVRAGIQTEKVRAEVFVRNLFDEDAWASGARFSDTAFPVDFGNFFVQQGVNVAPNDRQEFGVRVTYSF